MSVVIRTGRFERPGTAASKLLLGVSIEPVGSSASEPVPVIIDEDPVAPGAWSFVERLRQLADAQASRALPATTARHRRPGGPAAP